MVGEERDVIEDLKARARILQRKAARRDLESLARLRELSELRGLDDERLSRTVRRRHCLSTIARELGFQGWAQAAGILRGEVAEDYGTLLCPTGNAVHWNLWSASYEEARALREQTNGYLLAYRRHFFIVDRHYVETLGLDPDDADWECLGRDWARPVQAAARERLYAKLVRARFSEERAGEG